MECNIIMNGMGKGMHATGHVLACVKFPNKNHQDDRMRALVKQGRVRGDLR